jgi:hypothetical protein
MHATRHVGLTEGSSKIRDAAYKHLADTDLILMIAVKPARVPRLHCMVQSDHDPIAKFIRWLEDARRAQIPNYEATALATAAASRRKNVRPVCSAQGSR